MTLLIRFTNDSWVFFEGEMVWRYDTHNAHVLNVSGVLAQDDDDVFGSTVGDTVDVNIPLSSIIFWREV